MTASIAGAVPKPPFRIDLFRPAFLVLALVLAVLVVLPLSQIKLLHSDPAALDAETIKKKYEEYFGT